MPPIHFKLTQQDGPTRRISFQTFPTWDVLAPKLHTLFGIPAAHVGVSYLDSDNDEITVSSNEELEDFYQSCYQQGEVVKLSVLDLNANREVFKSFAHISPPNRNTFGQETFELIEHLHPFPGLVGITGIAPLFESDMETPHAFVDVVTDGDVSPRFKEEDAQSAISRTIDDDDRSTVLPPRVDKGKGRATSLDDLSTASVLAEEPADKHPIHVSDVSHIKSEDIPTVSTSDAGLTHDPVPTSHHDEATPIAEPIVLQPEQPAAGAGEHTPTQANAPLPFLSRDVASFLTSVSTFVAAHPELQESLRVIYRNATTGAYWQDDLPEEPHTQEREDAKIIISSLRNLFHALVPPTDQPLPTASAKAIQTEPNETRVTPEPVSHPKNNTSHQKDTSMSSVGSAPPPNTRPLVAPILTTVLSEPAEGITLNDHDLSRAQLESAKELYKREKERYRQEREQRRKEREELKAKKTAAPVPPPVTATHPVPPPPPKPMSADLWSVPTERNPFFAPPPPSQRPKAALGNEKKPDTIVARSAARVAKRLSEMGFPETRHPDLSIRIRDQLTKSRTINNDVEDNIVTNLLEELLVKSPRAGPSDTSHRRHFSDSWY